MKTAIEYRNVKGIEIRRAANSKSATLRGYAAVFNSPSSDLGGFVEIVRPGAFASSLADGVEVMALAYHDMDKPLARRSAGTLTISEDAKGLAVEINLADTTTARDLLADIEAGNVSGMSFGFCCRSGGDKWTINNNGQPTVRELIDVELIEVSAVTCPAYTDTSIAARSLESARSSKPAPAAPDPAQHARLNSLRLRLLDLSV